MKQFIENTTKAHLMVWELNPKKRNKNNIIKVNIDCSINIGIGDVIFATPGNETCSTYEVSEVLSSKPSSMKKYNYCVLKIKWKWMSTIDLLNMNIISSTKSTENLLSYFK